jgi:eukaryotic-like serine/threonine-protein kinase
VTLGRRTRVVARLPGRFMIHDIARDRRVLLTQRSFRVSTIVANAANPRERDASWLDFSLPSDLSPDGSLLLFSEQGLGSGATYVNLVRKLDGSPPVRLGEGYGAALSPDGKWALTLMLSSPSKLLAVPLGAGTARDLSTPGFQYQTFAGWFPDGNRVAFTAAAPGHGTRVYVQPLGGEPRAITPEGTMVPGPGGRVISPDGAEIVARTDGSIVAYAVNGSAKPKLLSGLTRDDVIAGWAAEPGRLFVYHYDADRAQTVIDAYDTATARRSRWKTIAPSDPAGLLQVFSVVVTPDGKSYAYGAVRLLSQLYVVSGLK